MKKGAIIGFGGLGKTHFLNLKKLSEERKDFVIAAICDVNINSVSENVQLNLGAVSVEGVDFSKYSLYTDFKKMIEFEDLDFVVITLPSFLHFEVASHCLKKGLDVFLEKPITLSLKHTKALISLAKKSGKKLMIGQILRFANEYKFLKELVETKKYGKAIKAEFTRKSPLPGWTKGGWLLDVKKSGGCIIDLHIHDVDMMVYLFGKPLFVKSISTHNMSEYESTYAIYKYPNLSASIIADWGIHESYKFKTTYNVTFENAYVEMVNGQVTIYENEGQKKIEFENTDMFYVEMSEFIDSVVLDKPFKTVDLDSVLETMKLVFKEKKLAKRKFI